MSEKWVGFWVICLIISSYLFYSSQQTQQNTLFTVEENAPTYKSNAMNANVYDMLGKINYQISAEQVEYFEKSGNSVFNKPIMTLYNEKAEPNWKIVSETAALSKNKMLSLNGNVEVNNLIKDSQLEKINGTNITVNLTTHDISSQEKITILGNNVLSQGQRFEGNLNSKTARIIDNVTTHYGISNEETFNP